MQGENSALLPTSGLLKCERYTVKGAEHMLALDGVERAHNRRRCVCGAKRCIHTLTTTPEGAKGIRDFPKGRQKAFGYPNPMLALYLTIPTLKRIKSPNNQWGDLIVILQDFEKARLFYEITRTA